MRKFYRSVVMTMAMSLFVLVAIISCSKKGEKPINKNNMDLSVKPGDDFFRYANGGWLDKIQIPDDKTSYTEFDILQEKRDEDLYQLLREIANETDGKSGSMTQKIGDFFVTGMDTERIETEKTKPLQQEFDRIANIKTIADVQDVIAHLHTIGLDPLFSGGVEQDLMDSKIYKFYLMQAGLGLPDRDYYTKQGDRFNDIRREYIKFVGNMFVLLGDDSLTAAQNAQTVMKIENRLAENSKTRLQMRNIPALYNKMSLRQLSKLAPYYDWQRYFTNISEIDFGDVIVGMPKFFKEVSALMQEISVDEWKTYLRWNVINNSAAYLSSDFVRENYHFYSEFLSGSKKLKKRWKRVVATVNRSIGEPLGKLYVKKYFPPESKKRMLELVMNLKKSLRQRIENLSWMSDSTKTEALAKLAAMKVKIGYPDKWEDYSKLKAKRDSYVLNVLRANKFQYYKNLNQFGKPVDPDKWGMSPQTVNAGYNPIKNDITFPAAILQPPFFNPVADDAVNYGAIGVVIGHEMTHGFDDQGRRFDKDGNMRDWWTKKDAEEFNKRIQLIVDQYDQFVAIGDLHINGKLTIGENIADFGGLTVALNAYKMIMNDNPAPKPIDGFTDLQRFFLGYAQVWRGKIRDKALRRKVQEDVHAWGKFRVNGALFNVPEFYQAFKISPEDKLYRTPEQRPVIW